MLSVSCSAELAAPPVAQLVKGVDETAKDEIIVLSAGVVIPKNEDEDEDVEDVPIIIRWALPRSLRSGSTCLADAVVSACTFKFLN